jgi:hypothetical protein
VIWVIFAHFIKLPKVNNDPIGENSSNLVTLPPAQLLSVGSDDAFL